MVLPRACISYNVHLVVISLNYSNAVVQWQTFATSGRLSIRSFCFVFQCKRLQYILTNTEHASYGRHESHSLCSFTRFGVQESQSATCGCSTKVDLFLDECAPQNLCHGQVVPYRAGPYARRCNMCTDII